REREREGEMTLEGERESHREEGENVSASVRLISADSGSEGGGFHGSEERIEGSFLAKRRGQRLREMRMRECVRERERESERERERERARERERNGVEKRRSAKGERNK